jgi:hypothetical protein
MPTHAPYRRPRLDPLGLVAGRCDELALGDVIDPATPHHPDMRDRTGGEAVNAMVRTGCGSITPALELVPRFCQNTPTARLISPRVVAGQRHDDARARAVETLYGDGVTERYRRMAATAAQRLGLAPRLAPLARTRLHVDGRDNRDEEPMDQGSPITRGYRRAPRPDLNQDMRELIGEPQAGSPVRMTPLSAHRREAQDVGEVIRTPVHQVHIPYGLTYVVADRALYRAANLQQLAQTPLQWSTRVPATVSDAQAAWAQVDPQALAPLTKPDRYGELPSLAGDVPPRWLLLYSALRPTPAQRPVDQGWRQPSDQAGHVWKKLCPTPWAGEAAARQVLATFAHPVQATCLAPGTVDARPRFGKRGRPGRDAPPEQGGAPREEALAAALTSRPALIDHQQGVILATHALDDAPLPPPALWEGDKGQGHAARGGRFWKDPPVLASALYLQKPERSRALVLGMTVCWLVDAAFADRLR